MKTNLFATLLADFCLSVKPLFKRKFRIDYHVLLFLSSCILGLFYNNLFWGRAQAFIVDNGGFLLKASVYTAFVFIVWLLLEILCVRIWTRWVLSFIFLISSVASYFMDLLSIGLDSGVIDSMLHTTLRESSELLTFSFLYHLLVFGIFPTLIFFIIPLSVPLRFIYGLKLKTYIVCILLSIIVGIYFVQGTRIIEVFKHSHDLMRTLNPVAPFRAYIDYIIKRMKLPTDYIVLGDDAITTAESKLFVFVIGESARAHNFKELGYERDTTPYSVNFPNRIFLRNFYSCGVITAISIPCMLTNYTRATYTHRELSFYTDNVLDVAKKAGYEVYWISNNGGECIGGVCKRLDQDKIIYFNTRSSLDGDMIPLLSNLIQNTTSNTLLVVNLLGSHGVRYDKRYPKEFEYFVPACNKNVLSQCSVEELLNAYDNSLRYTDFLLSLLLQELDSSVLEDVGLWYLSDHGESLGENGQYMHGGFPYVFAPKYQKHIPSILWLKPPQNIHSPYAQWVQEVTEKLFNKQDSLLNQDYVFSTLLGLLQITTKDYKREFDITR